MNGERGRSMVEVSVVLALAGLLWAAAPSLSGSWRQRAVEGATRSLAAQLRRLSLEAVAQGRDHALVFPLDMDEPALVVVDSGEDGISRAGVSAGADATIEMWKASRDHAGTLVGIPDWDPMPLRAPPSRLRMNRGDPALRFGRARMVTVTAEGHATPGSIYLTDGHQQLCAIVLNGATARTRVWCYRRGDERWERR